LTLKGGTVKNRYTYLEIRRYTWQGDKQKTAPGGAVRAALEGPWKCGKNCVSLAPLWSSRFDARPRDTPWVPLLAYKYPEIFKQKGEEFLG